MPALSSKRCQGMLPDASAFAIMTASAVLLWLNTHCATQLGCGPMSGRPPVLPIAGCTSAVPIGPVLPYPVELAGLSLL